MKPTLDEIIQATAMRFQVATHEVVGCNARKVYSRPRHVAMYLARELTGYSSPQIGRHFSRDHTTVLYAVKRVNRLVTRDGEFSDHLNASRAMALRLALMRSYRLQEALRKPLVMEAA